MTKKIICIALTVLMILGTFTACQTNPSQDQYVTSTIWVDVEDEDADKDNTSGSDKTSSTGSVSCWAK